MALTYQSSQTNNTGTGTTTVVVTKPVSLAVGDIMVGMICAQGGTGTFPGGWTILGNVNNNESSTLAWKIADSGDTAASNFTFTSSFASRLSGAIARISGSDTSVGSYTGAGGTSTASITPTYNSFIMIFTHGNSSDPSSVSIATDNPTFTKMFSAISGVNCLITGWYGYRPQNTATGTGSSSGGTVLGVHMFEIKVLPTTQTISENLSTSDSVANVMSGTLTESILTEDDFTGEKSRTWTNASKPSTTWTNESK